MLIKDEEITTIVKSGEHEANIELTNNSQSVKFTLEENFFKLITFNKRAVFIIEL